jgi:hypothetical protein
MDQLNLLGVVIAGGLLGNAICALVVWGVWVLIKRGEAESRAMEMDLDAFVFHDEARLTAARSKAQAYTYRGRDINA